MAEIQNKQSKTVLLVICAVLSAFGILIPLVIPRIPIIPGVMTVTLASHVPIMLAMFINPFAAATVALTTALGFFISTTPLIAIRALSHIFFAVIMSLFAKKMLTKKVGTILLCVLASLIHATAETASVHLFAILFKDIPIGFELTFYNLFMFIGLITFAHSTVDFILAYFVYLQLKRNKIILPNTY